MVKVLSKELNFEVVEWIDPGDLNERAPSGKIVGEYISRIQQFSNFVSKAEKLVLSLSLPSFISTNFSTSSSLNRYPLIALVDEESLTQSVPETFPFLSSLSFSSASRKIILLEAIPFLHDDRQLREFRAVISDFLNSGRFPLVFISSDDAYENNPITKLLPPNILNSPSVKEIKFVIPLFLLFLFCVLESRLISATESIPLP